MTPRQGTGLRHEALFYANHEEFLAGAVSFADAGIEAGETVLAALPGPRRLLLQGEIDPQSTQVRFLSMEELGRNPGRLISAWRDFLDDEESQGIRALGELIWPGRTSAEIEECERHERLLNLAFDGEPGWTLMCLYDAGALSDEVLSAAAQTHQSPAASGALLEGSLPPPSGASFELRFGKAELRQVRLLVSERAGTAGLDSRRTDDLVLAACELATNSVQHGGGEGELWVWYEDGRLICDVHDPGRIDDPLVGQRRPPADQVGGRGLWIANQICDLVQVRSGENGTQVRLQMAVDG